MVDRKREAKEPAGMKPRNQDALLYDELHTPELEERVSSPPLQHTAAMATERDQSSPTPDAQLSSDNEQITPNPASIDESDIPHLYAVVDKTRKASKKQHGVTDSQSTPLNDEPITHHLVPTDESSSPHHLQPECNQEIVQVEHNKSLSPATQLSCDESLDSTEDAKVECR